MEADRISFNQNDAVLVVRHDGFNVGLGMAVDDAAGQRDQRLDPGGGLFGERGAWVASPVRGLMLAALSCAARASSMRPVGGGIGRSDRMGMAAIDVIDTTVSTWG